jgi:hypothetical protein
LFVFEVPPNANETYVYQNEYYVFRYRDVRFVQLPIKVSPHASDMGTVLAFSKSRKRTFLIPSENGKPHKGVVISTLPGASTLPETKLLLQGVSIQSILSFEDGRYVVAIPSDQNGIYVIDSSTTGNDVKYLPVTRGYREATAPDLEWSRLTLGQ